LERLGRREQRNLLLKMKKWNHCHHRLHLLVKNPHHHLHLPLLLQRFQKYLLNLKFLFLLRCLRRLLHLQHPPKKGKKVKNCLHLVLHLQVKNLLHHPPPKKKRMVMNSVRCLLSHLVLPHPVKNLLLQNNLNRLFLHFHNLKSCLLPLPLLKNRFQNLCHLLENPNPNLHLLTQERLLCHLPRLLQENLLLLRLQENLHRLLLRDRRLLLRDRRLHLQVLHP
jgi:hypothetical protein